MLLLDGFRHFQSYMVASEVMVWEWLGCGSHLPARVKCSGAWRTHKRKRKKSKGDLIVLCYYPVYLLYLYSS